MNKTYSDKILSRIRTDEHLRYIGFGVPAKAVKYDITVQGAESGANILVVQRGPTNQQRLAGGLEMKEQHELLRRKSRTRNNHFTF